MLSRGDILILMTLVFAELERSPDDPLLLRVRERLRDLVRDAPVESGDPDLPEWPHSEN